MFKITKFVHLFLAVRPKEGFRLLSLRLLVLIGDFRFPTDPHLLRRRLHLPLRSLRLYLVSMLRLRLVCRLQLQLGSHVARSGGKLGSLHLEVYSTSSSSSTLSSTSSSSCTLVLLAHPPTRDCCSVTSSNSSLLLAQRIHQGRHVLLALAHIVQSPTLRKGKQISINT